MDVKIVWEEVNLPPINLWNVPKMEGYLLETDFIVPEAELEVAKANGEFFQYTEPSYEGKTMTVEGYAYRGVMYITNVKEENGK